MFGPPPSGDPARDALVGVTLDGRWRVLRRIGEGAMGVVYLAEQANLHREVALKLLHEEYLSSDEHVRRFAREARALSLLQHVNCTSILDVGEHQERPYIVIELVSGHRLTVEIGTPAMTPVRAVGLIRQALMGLRHAHGHGIVHRDMKPDNLMVTELAGVGDVVKILDFGFAHITDSRHSQSNANVVPGTPGYMSPEQAQGLKADERTDLYSTGIILYELCVGRKPFVAEDPMRVLSMHIHQAPLAPRLAAPDRKISPELEEVILRALAKSREERFADAEAFQLALEATPEGSEIVRNLGVSSEAARRQARKWAVAAAVLAVVTVAVAAAAVTRRPKPAAISGEAPAAAPRTAPPAAPATTPGPAVPAPASAPAAAAAAPAPAQHGTLAPPRQKAALPTRDSIPPRPRPRKQRAHR